MHHFKSSFWGMILLAGVMFLFFGPLASAQLQLAYSPISSPMKSHLNPDSIPFGPPVNYATGQLPFSVFCADLDFDSDLDLAVTRPRGDNVSILRNISRHFVCGDVDCDNKASITDLVYLVNFIFKSGPLPGECAR